MLHQIKKHIYANFFSSDISDFKKEAKGRYLNLVTQDMSLLNENYIVPKCEIVSSISSGIASLIAIFLIDWKLALSFILISLFTILFSQIPSKLLSKKTNAFSSSNSAFLNEISNYLSGFEQIKLLNVQKLFNEKIVHTHNQFENARKEFTFYKKMSVVIAMFISFFSQILCMSIGVWFVLRGDLSIGLLISSIQLLNGVFKPLQALGKNRSLIHSSKGIKHNLEKKMQISSVIKESLRETVTSIAITDLSLTLSGKELYSNLSYNFEENKKYAIIGESGTGKSTLAKVIMGYFEGDYKGDIHINKDLLKEISNDSIHNKISYITKNDFILDGTVEENITLNRSISKDVVLSVVKSLKLSDELLKRKIESNSHHPVSAGEKQRIDIARFLVRDSDVLIFDEPASNLDPETSKIINNYILNIQDKIVIVITHDQNTDFLNHFDEVIQLNQKTQNDFPS